MPSNNGRTEIVRKTIKTILSYYVNKNQTNWPQLLPYIIACYKFTPHSSTKFSHHEIIYGTKMNSSYSISLNNTDTQSLNEHVQNLAKKLKSIWHNVSRNNNLAFKAQASQKNKAANEIYFQIGQKVLLTKPAIGVGKKSPYIITSIISPVAIEIEMNDKKIMVHAYRLKPYKQRKGELPLFSATQQQNPERS
ncbi:hypothetical protein B566_EDAN013068 [Ephemera danica]|nr:hypothetical protein B566_EDAN013068 [Ephemera danica]